MPKLSFSLPKKSVVVSNDSIKQAVTYTHEYWKHLVRNNTKDSGTLVGLPHPYIVPAQTSPSGFQFEEQYYWDSYFTAIGLPAIEYQPVVEGMLENLIYLLKKFHLIPNASRMYMTSRSQPPLLTSYIFYVYDTYKKDEKWLKNHIEIAINEYNSVWMSTTHPMWHQVHMGLSRYYDINMLHDLAEAESGWDMTPRFERKCLDYLPVDLNALLYKYETDFARYSHIIGDEHQEKLWQQKAHMRKTAMTATMWANLRGFFFDYNYRTDKKSDCWSLAAYYTMWSGLATKEQAAKLVANLEKFEKKGGLTTTLKPLIDIKGMFGSVNVQWAYPNGWAPLHYIVTEGLRNYGYIDRADRIAAKWLKTNIEWFEQNGAFIEKYNVVNPKKPPVEGVYPSQEGFGWTNSILNIYAKQFLSQKN